MGGMGRADPTAKDPSSQSIMTQGQGRASRLSVMQASAEVVGSNQGFVSPPVSPMRGGYRRQAQSKHPIGEHDNVPIAPIDDTVNAMRENSGLTRGNSQLPTELGDPSDADLAHYFPTQDHTRGGNPFSGSSSFNHRHANSPKSPHSPSGSGGDERTPMSMTAKGDMSHSTSAPEQWTGGYVHGGVHRSSKRVNDDDYDDYAGQGDEWANVRTREGDEPSPQTPRMERQASVDPRDMSDAEAQAVPFVEFELSRHVPPTRNVEPETKLPGEQRAKGRVVFHYLYHGRQMRKTELTTGFTCPFCLCVNRDFDGMSRHLEACHDAFNFEFLPKVQNEADPRVHVVCRSEEEVRSKNGSGEVRKESARRKEASEWFFKHGGWFVQSKAKVQMTHHELDDDGGVVRKDVSPTCADQEFVYASTRYHMPRWLQHQRSQHHASVSAPGPRGPYRRRIDKEVEKVAQLKQRAEAAEIQHQLKIQRHQLEQLQRHRHQQFAGRHRLVGDINHILTPQVHPGLLNHLMLNQGPGGQLGMQQGLQLGGQLGGLGGSAFAGGISGLNTGGMSGLSTNAAYGLGLAGMTPTHQLQQQQLQQQQMQQQQQLQQLLLRQQGHQQHQPFPPRKDVIRAWVEHRLQDVDPVALARELGITPREIEAGDSMIRELRGHMSILTEAHAAAGKVLYVPKPKPKPNPARPPIGPAYMAGVPPPDDDVRVRGDPSSPTNFVNLTGAAAADDDDVFEHDERVRHRRKTRDLNEVTRAAARRYKKMEKWSTRDVGRPKKPKTTEVSGVKAPGLDFLMEAVTEDRGAESADTAVRGKDKDKGGGKDKGAERGGNAAASGDDKYERLWKKFEWHRRHRQQKEEEEEGIQD